MRVHKHISKYLFRLRVIRMYLLIFCLTICPFSNASNIQDKKLESYDAILLDERFLNIERYSSDVVFEESIKTLEHFKYIVLTANKEDGIIISRLHKFHMSTTGMGGGSDDSPPSSSPAYGNQYFLILRNTMDDEGRNVLHCMIAKPVKHWGDRIAEKVLKQFVDELKSNLDKLQ